MEKWTDAKYMEVWARLMGAELKPLNMRITVMWESRENTHWTFTKADGSKCQIPKDRLDPLSDWNQCMMLVEKMEAEGWRWCAQLYNKKYVFEFLGNARIGHHVSDNLNRAIIRACALAMEVE